MHNKYYLKKCFWCFNVCLLILSLSVATFMIMIEYYQYFSPFIVPSSSFVLFICLPHRLIVYKDMQNKVP